MSIVFTLFATGALAYDVDDLDKLRITVDGPSETLVFDLTLNDDNRFSAEIQNLDAGMTNIALSGFDKDGTEMYNGDWEGNIRADGKPTQVALYMIDLSPDIDYATVSNIAPFFTSIQVEPSNIAHNETLEVRTRAKDLDGTEFNYTFNAIDTLHGVLVPCDNGGEYCTTTYTSSELDTNGVKSFQVAVSDGDDQDSIIGAFNVRAYGGIDIEVAFNTRPGASSISVGPSSFLHGDNDVMYLNVTVFDDVGGSWEWSVNGNGTECDPSRLGGDVAGNFSAVKETFATFTAQEFTEDSSCSLQLHVRDGITAGLEYHLTVPVFTGTPKTISAPHVVFAYSTSRKPSVGDTVTYLVRAADVDVGSYIYANWSLSSASTGNVTTTSTTDLSSASGSMYEFTMQMASSGYPGAVTCTLTDSDGLMHNVTFDVEAAGVLYQISDSASLCPSGTQVITDRTECMDAVTQLGHTWGESSPHASLVQFDGGGYCMQCLYCDSEPISYMVESDLLDPWLKRYCRPSTSRRRLAVDAPASGGPSPYVFGLDMRIQDGTLYVSSNQVPRIEADSGSPQSLETYAGQHNPTKKSQVSSVTVAACAAAGVALVAAGFAMNRIRKKRDNQAIDV